MVRRQGHWNKTEMWIRIRFNADPDSGENVNADPDPDFNPVKILIWDPDSDPQPPFSRKT